MPFKGNLQAERQPLALAPIELLLAWWEESRRGHISCIAYREDGDICGQPATVLDRQRHGMVCTAHALPRTEETAPGGVEETP